MKQINQFNVQKQWLIENGKRKKITSKIKKYRCKCWWAKHTITDCRELFESVKIVKNNHRINDGLASMFMVNLIGMTNLEGIVLAFKLKPVIEYDYEKHLTANLSFAIVFSFYYLFNGLNSVSCSEVTLGSEFIWNQIEFRKMVKLKS